VYVLSKCSSRINYIIFSQTALLSRQLIDTQSITITTVLQRTTPASHAALTDIDSSSTGSERVTTETLNAIFCTKVFISSTESSTSLKCHAATCERLGSQCAGADFISHTAIEIIGPDRRRMGWTTSDGVSVE
jgi:hypothetical protein